MTAADSLLAVADAVADRLADESPSAALHAGRPVRRLASLASEEVESSARFMAERLAELRRIDLTGAPVARRAFRDALAIDLERRVEAARTHLLAFAVTPYRGGDLHYEAQAAFAAQPVETAEAREAYLSLVRDYARLLGEMLDHTREQVVHGTVLPAAALPGARATLAYVSDGLPALLQRPGEDALNAAVDAIRVAEIDPALAALIAYVGSDYPARASDACGYHIHPGGADFYRSQIALFADSTATPEEIHRVGIDMLAAIASTRRALADRLLPGVALAEAEARLRADPRGRAATGAAIGERYRAHMTRVEPMMPRWFLRQPKAPWSIDRASRSMEAGMSFGDYSRPSAADPVGRYRYNGSDPAERSLLGAAHLIYHELLPGHHYQLALQDEAEVVHPLQTRLLSMATIEGWAVYASDLAAEMGAMDDYDLYGHAVMQGFIAARLVVDTGLNAMGWTLEQARAFLRDHTAESETTIASEVIRYATDIPGQALAYGLGHRAIAGMRAGATAALGDAFDIRRFHDRLLGAGGYPLPVLETLIDDWVTEERA